MKTRTSGVSDFSVRNLYLDKNVHRVSQQSSCDRPKVSVAMISYNHEKFIAQAIESVLMQETKFQVELIIGEDCSTDDTRKIVQNYAEKYPRVICPILQKTNQGMTRNSLAVFAACRGRYIAMLEGDDYWTANDKLERQASYLDEHPEVSLIFHQSVPLLKSGALGDHMSKHRDIRSFTFTEFAALEVGSIPTASVLVRRQICDNLPDWYKDLPFGDMTIQAMAAEVGKIVFLPECWSIYRVHAGGVASQMRFLEKGESLTIMLRMHDGMIKLYTLLIGRAERVNRKTLRKSIATLNLEAAWYARLAARRTRTIRHLANALANDWLGTISGIYFWKMLIIACVPYSDVRIKEHLAEYQSEKSSV